MSGGVAPKYPGSGAGGGGPRQMLGLGAGTRTRFLPVLPELARQRPDRRLSEQRPPRNEGYLMSLRLCRPPPRLRVNIFN